MLMSAGVRALAWSMRKKGIQALRQALAAPGLAFHREKRLLAETETIIQQIIQLRDDITG